MYRHGQRQFLLLFADGSRRVVPVVWTDAAAGGAKRGTGAVRSLASISDLLRTRTIVEALLRRIETEQEHATGPRLPEARRPGSNVWRALDDEQRIVVLDVLTRLMAQTGRPQSAAEGDDE